MLNNKQLSLIHSALEKCAGNRKDAAALLGISCDDLKTILHNNKSLKARWTESRDETEAPSGAVTLHRPTIPAKAASGEGEAVLSEKEIAEAMAKEDALVRGGLEALGVKGGSLDMAMALQKFHNKHFQRAIEMLGGGVTKQFLDLMAEVQAITDKLNDRTSPPLDPNQELMLREDRSRLLDLMQKFYDRANQAVLTQAKVKAMQSSGKGGKGGGPKKPGFAPLLVHADNLTIQENK